ncbi:MAG: Gfo/Idh/MocA family oxidoreductase [Planctomycetaceae bacterium]|nr:Gfo/Idh/MocA family oxidoreductase [Planctomycetaceae bacterium]
MSERCELGVIGVGQLGSRHLQALARLNRPARVHVVDPVPAALERACARFAEVAANDGRVELVLADDIAQLPRKLAAVVVATNADHRATVIDRLLQHTSVPYLVLEKVLFQRDGDYGDIADRLERAGSRAWVNCPRRLFEGYRTLRQRLSAGGPIEYRVQGDGWGLACNSIHFVDHAAFLSRRDDFRMTAVQLEPGCNPSKRAGYVEFFGTVRGEFGDGSRISMTCRAEGTQPLSIQVLAADGRYDFDESQAAIRWTPTATGETESFPLVPTYQSQLTQLVIQDLLDHGTCGLTPYAESVRLHRPLLAAFLGHYRTHADAGAESCPIT